MHTYIHTYIHTHIHTYIHVHMCRFLNMVNASFDAGMTICRRGRNCTRLGTSSGSSLEGFSGGVSVSSFVYCFL